MATDSALSDAFDLELTRNSKRYLLQLRNWKSSSIDIGSLQELRDRLEDAGADGALVLISGHAFPDAEDFAEETSIALVDGHGLKDLILSRGSELPLPDRSTTKHPEKHLYMEKVPRKDAEGNDGPPGGDVAEQSLGRALGALIRDALQVGEDSVASQKATPTPPALPVETDSTSSVGADFLSRFRGTIRVGRVVDTLGMVLALGLVWVSWEWFDALPASPVSSHSPWSLLGKSRTLTESASGEKRNGGSLRPLGQMAYGPEFPLAVPPEQAGRPLVSEPDPVEVFRSIRELEDAFNARYVPPSSCYDWSDSGGLAECGNHRIRARRAFIASNGRTMVPSQQPEPQPATGDSWAAVPEDEPASRARKNRWSLSSEDYGREPDPGPILQWQSELTEDPLPDETRRPWRDETPDPYTSWWPPRNSGSVSTWRDEQRLREQRLRQDADPFEDSGRDGTWGSRDDSGSDWRQEWPR
jgi:hypothetical protein